MKTRTTIIAMLMVASVAILASGTATAHEHGDIHQEGKVFNCEYKAGWSEEDFRETEAWILGAKVESGFYYNARGIVGDLLEGCGLLQVKPAF